MKSSTAPQIAPYTIEIGGIEGPIMEPENNRLRTCLDLLQIVDCLKSKTNGRFPDNNQSIESIISKMIPQTSVIRCRFEPPTVTSFNTLRKEGLLLGRIAILNLLNPSPDWILCEPLFVLGPNEKLEVCRRPGLRNF